MNAIIKTLEKSDKYIELRNILKLNPDLNMNNKLSIIGLTDSAKSLCIYSITKEISKSALIVCTNVFQAKKIIENLKNISDIEIIFLPAKKMEYYDVDSQSREIENERAYAIKKILSRDVNIVVTTIDALLQKIIPKKSQEEFNISLKVGDNIELEKLTQDLVKLGYERAELVEGKGQFAVRGGIVDIFALDYETPFRIELFGNEIDNIRSFDNISQRSIDTLNNIVISAISENTIDINLQQEIISNLKELTQDRLLPSNLKLNILKDIDKIENKNYDTVIDKYFELFSKENFTILDLLDSYNIFIDEASKCIEKSKNIVYENMETLKILAEKEYIYLPYANHYLSFEEILPKLNKTNNVYMESIKTSYYNEYRKEIFFDTKEQLFYRSNIEILLEDIRKNNNKIILLVFPNRARIEQIKNYLLENNIKVQVIEDILSKEEFKIGEVYITFGIMSTGFVSDEFNFCLIVEDVQGVDYKSKKRKEKIENSSKINSFDDLEIDDYVVHENHGIGLYKGINTVEIQGIQKDYIKIEYLDGGVLYVPITQLDLVKKYTCDDDTSPKLNSLGTKEWSKTKRKVSEHIKEVAKELMLLYAKRDSMKGFAYPEDTPWQQEFEDSFEFELTEDQKRSVREIKQDMQSDKPMDRLLCGDVGYGKTEVALRAAFKAVMSGKQVAYLVPTTVLCLQQYRTFSDRMQNFGIKVEMLSRFKSTKEQAQIINDLKNGRIDVVIGTHRMLSKDVVFKDLGLLVIDEEHRFGVKAKETIKMYKETVDVLSMTATPIPRTLHMSMIGIRGMSTLSEPPMERLPVHTYVLEYDANVIKRAIEKEIERDGQVFYISNRINNIEEVAFKVRNLVPNARVQFAHGRMDPNEIEDIMIDFMEHKIDVLICTTILESGIDIPNANTIIIENADKLGLAQLYQIRGRVGRSNRLAYAYITYKKDKYLSEVSQKRLKAIRDFTEFGSGFKIALRDLEIRGAGNLLGKEQHGHMVKVGYEMYISMLEKAINLEKAQKDKSLVSSVNINDQTENEVKIDINVSAYISDKYINDPIQKIYMYQKISEIRNNDDVMDVVDELYDRYGEIPKETENLITIVEIRNKAKEMGITKISQINDVIRFESDKFNEPNFRFHLTNAKNNDILIRVQLEIEKLYKNFKEKG